MTIRACRSVRPPLRSVRTLRILFVVLAISLAWSPSLALATTFTVNDNGDGGDATPGDNVCETVTGNGICTLRAAIQEANAHAGTDAIDVNPLTITLGSGEIDIAGAQTLTITGTAGAASTIVDGATTSRVLGIGAGATVTINGLTIQNGKQIGPFASGGCISTAGTLTMSDSIVTGCESSAGGGAIFNQNATLNLVRTVVSNSKSAQAGGAFMNNGSPAPINLTDCTVKDNQGAGPGGGIFNSGDTVTATNTTFSGNQSSSIGGAIDNNNFGTLILTNCTLSGNTAASSGGAINGSNTNTINLRNATITNNTGGVSAGAGGGVVTQGTINARNTIIAGNITDSGNQPDCSGSLVSEGFNLIGDTTGCTITGDATGNITGVPPASLHLGLLADNGGLTQTHALLPGSPAIDAGNPAAPGGGGVTCEANDQTGTTRPVDGDGNGSAVCDMGAFEVAVVPTTPTPTTTPSPTPTATPTSTATSTATPTATLTGTPIPTVTGTPGAEICDNCIDDDNNGQYDRLDPACSVPDGGGVGLGDAGRGKKLVKCAGAIQKAGTKLESTRLAKLQKCVDAVFACAQVKDGDAKCIAKAQAGCNKSIASFTADDAALAAKIQKSCGPPAVASADLLATTGLGFGFSGPASTCTLLGVATPTDAASVATCVARAHACRAAAALGFEAPRAAELLAVVGHTASEFPCLPPVPPGASAGSGLGDATRGKLAVKCEAAAKKAGAKLVATELKSLQKCINGVFTCVQVKPNDAKCMPKAQAGCGKASDKLEDQNKGLGGKLLAAVIKGCQTSGLDLADVLDANGVGVSALESECTAAGNPGIQNGVTSLAVCLTTFHKCRAGQLLESEMPRLQELLSLGGAALPFGGF